MKNENILARNKYIHLQTIHIITSAQTAERTCKEFRCDSPNSIRTNCRLHSGLSCTQHRRSLRFIVRCSGGNSRLCVPKWKNSDKGIDTKKKTTYETVTLRIASTVILPESLPTLCLRGKEPMTCVYAIEGVKETDIQARNRGCLGGEDPIDSRFTL